MPDVEMKQLEKSLERYQGFVVAGLAFIVVFAVTMAGVMLWQAYRLGEQSQDIKRIALTSQASLCALERDVASRYDATIKYMKNHPNGLVSERTGETLISVAQLQSSANAQKATLDALASGGLICDTGGTAR